jgi:3-hydroxyisobutyrate dehydrogenase
MSNTKGVEVKPGSFTIGFVGIGNMGTPMTLNLIKAGWQVMIYDVDTAKTAAFAREHGCKAASTLEELGKACPAVVTMLPDGHVVRKVVLGGQEGGDSLAKGFAKGSIVVDMSSSAPVGTRELGKDLEARGLALLDAPVSGGVKGAVNATLAIMVGGDESLAKHYDAMLAPMGRRFYAGSLGAGHATKALNNYVSAAGLVAAGEAMLIGKRFGIDPNKLLEIINASTGRNNSTENKFAQFILNHQFNSGFSLGLMTKDLGLAMEVADKMGVTAELGHSCLKLWKDAEGTLGGREDHTGVVKHLGELP